MIAGLRPYPAMKDSGVPWLGEVPEHWEVRRLKYAVSFSGSGTPSKANALFWSGHLPSPIKKIHKHGAAADPLRGLFPTTIAGKPTVVEYEPDSELRDTEQIPLLEEGGIEAFLRREVLPHAPDAWYVPGRVKTGYEVSFTRYFYKPKPMRSLEEIRADVLALEQETGGLLGEIVGGALR